LETPEGLVAVSAMEIRRSDPSPPSGVVMLFLRFLRTAGTSGGREDALPASGSSWLGERDRGSAATFVQPESATRVSSYARIRDLDGRPIATFAISAPREIYSLGRRMALTLLGSNALLIAAFGIAVAVLMIRLQRSLAAKHTTE